MRTVRSGVAAALPAQEARGQQEAGRSQATGPDNWAGGKTRQERRRDEDRSSPRAERLQADCEC